MISVEDFESFLGKVGKKIFTVTFLKKDGSLRTMVCKRGVKKYLTKGGVSTIKDYPNLIGVYEMPDKGYKCFDVSRVVSAKSGDLEIS